MTGVLHVVGVGPGDPELMTLKATRIIGAAPVVAYFSKRGRPGHARGIATACIAPNTRELRFEYPYTVEIDVTDPRYLDGMADFYAHCAETISTCLTQGQDVALLCEGDPFFYGSAMYLYDRLRERHPTSIVPGITGMSGCWSEAGEPMTHGDDVLSVLPGTLDEDSLTQRLLQADATVIMKLGRNLPKIRRALTRAGLSHRALYVAHGTMAEQKVQRLDTLDDAPVPYFALVLVPGRQRPR